MGRKLRSPPSQQLPDAAVFLVLVSKNELGAPIRPVSAAPTQPAVPRERFNHAALCRQNRVHQLGGRAVG